MIDEGVCGKGFIWNPSNWEWECDKSCDTGEYLDYSNCQCRKKLVDKLTGECTENIEETRLFKKTSARNEHENTCSSCTLYIALFSISFTISIGITTYFTYFYWYLSKYDARVMLDTRTKTTIYWNYKWKKLKKET